LNIRGIRILTDRVFTETSEPFLLARDLEFRGYLVASARLAELIQQQRLRVQVMPYGEAYPASVS